MSSTRGHRGTRIHSLPIILENSIGDGCLQMSKPEVVSLEMCHIQWPTLLEGPCGGDCCYVWLKERPIR